jgi:hypothetical protein
MLITSHAYVRGTIASQVREYETERLWYLLVVALLIDKRGLLVPGRVDPKKDNKCRLEILVYVLSSPNSGNYGAALSSRMQKENLSKT